MFFLARTVAHTLDVDALKETLAYRDLQRWKAAYRLDPWGDDWDQAAIIACAAYNPHSKRKLKPKEVKPKFRKRRRQTAEEAIRQLDGMGQRG